MRFVFLNQTFHPDVMATGQYLVDVALALAERGHRVTVVTSRRAYDQPEREFPKEETWRGIRIVRVGSTGFGKAAKWRRAADFASFLVMCAWRALFLSRAEVVVALTSPPLISVLGALVSRLRGSRFVYWVMDFNPDEAIAAGWLRAGSFAARLLERLSLFSLRQASKIIVLDRFMRERIVAKGIAPGKIEVLGPWAQDRQIKFDPCGRERFRQAHGLDGKFVVMYSGNHSPCHPLNTLLEAAERLADDPGMVFCFVGGGSEWRRIGEIQNPKSEITSPSPRSAARILRLPYQPWSELAGSLSAADLQVVVMGDRFVGLVHPCKIYNILAVGAPVLYIGPAPSHVTEIFGPAASVSLVHHGDVASVVECVRRVRSESACLDRAVWNGVAGRYSLEKLLPQFVAVLESA